MSFPPLARDLQLWPELVEIGSEVHTGRRSSLYTAVFQGQRVVFKVSTALQSDSREGLYDWDVQ